MNIEQQVREIAANGGDDGEYALIRNSTLLGLCDVVEAARRHIEVHINATGAAVPTDLRAALSRLDESERSENVKGGGE